jgi:hypothetical protein
VPDETFIKHVTDMECTFTEAEGEGDACYPNRKVGPFAGMDNLGPYTATPKLSIWPVLGLPLDSAGARSTEVARSAVAPDPRLR